MSKYRALYTDYPWADLAVEQSILDQVDCEIVSAPNGDEETLAQLAVDCDTILTCWAQVTERVINASPNCQHIARTGIGLDNIDIPHATRRGIVVTNVPDYCIPEVVEHTLALLLALARKIHIYDRATQRGEYKVQLGLPLERLEDQTIGIVGLGQIGGDLARRLVAMGMSVVGHNRSQQVPEGVSWLPLEELLSTSDFVSLLCPLTSETHHLINAETLALMKPTASLINTARGGLIDHEALSAALVAGQLGGAGLDVQAVEPPDLARPPYNDPRVIVTPHAAYYSTRAVRELRERVATQAVAVLRGERPGNVVNPSVLPGS